MEGRICASQYLLVFCSLNWIPYLVLVAEDVVVDVVLLGALGREDEGLHEPAHGLPVVAELARHLHHHAVRQGLVTVHLNNIGNFGQQIITV